MVYNKATSINNSNKNTPHHPAVIMTSAAHNNTQQHTTDMTDSTSWHHDHAHTATSLKAHAMLLTGIFIFTPGALRRVSPDNIELHSYPAKTT
jgi:hypothetical protein